MYRLHLRLPNRELEQAKAQEDRGDEHADGSIAITDADTNKNKDQVQSGKS